MTRIEMNWGRWYLNINAMDLRYDVNPSHTYEIPLETCCSEERRARWIEHIVEKSWATDRDIVNLRMAFDWLLERGYFDKD